MGFIASTYIDPSLPYHDRLVAAHMSLTARVARKPGAPARRWRFERAALRLVGAPKPDDPRQEYARKQTSKALGLARMAAIRFDEHLGSTRGDHMDTRALDYVGPSEALAAPYMDSGRAGLGLVSVTRKRVYAKSSGWWPRITATVYLVGRNEAGTFFAHAVKADCTTVPDALQWIWQGHAREILRRQGDIAVISGRAGKLPTLPGGHRVQGSQIVHATHPPIALPGKGERLIVGRRAMARVSNETRD